MSRNSTMIAPGDYTVYLVFDDKMINHQRIWLKVSQLINYLLFYIPYKIFQHSLASIHSIA